MQQLCLEFGVALGLVFEVFLGFGGFFDSANHRVLIPLDLLCLSAAQFGEAVPSIGLIRLLSSMRHPNTQ